MQKPELIPTKSEIEILQVIWDFGPSTVRFVNGQINKIRLVQYSSTLKQMQVMTQKKFLTRNEHQVQHIYNANIDEHKTKGLLLENMVISLYKGSASGLFMQLLGNKKTSEEELDKIRKLLGKTRK